MITLELPRGPAARWRPLREWVDLLVRLVEAAGALIIFVGRRDRRSCASRALAAATVGTSAQFTAVRLGLGRYLLLGLEFQLASDLLNDHRGAVASRRSASSRRSRPSAPPSTSSSARRSPPQEQEVEGDGARRERAAGRRAGLRGRRARSARRWCWCRTRDVLLEPAGARRPAGRRRLLRLCRRPGCTEELGHGRGARGRAPSCCPRSGAALPAWRAGAKTTVGRAAPSRSSSSAMQRPVRARTRRPSPGVPRRLELLAVRQGHRLVGGRARGAGRPRPPRRRAGRPGEVLGQLLERARLGEVERPDPGAAQRGEVPADAERRRRGRGPARGRRCRRCSPRATSRSSPRARRAASKRDTVTGAGRQLDRPPPRGPGRTTARRRP